MANRQINMMRRLLYFMTDVKTAYAIELGVVNNLIFNMATKGASEEEIRKVVDYSMSLIDAAKAHHYLSVKSKEIELETLKKKYLDPVNG